MVKSPNSGVFIFNAWHEAWGNHRWFPCKAGDPNVPAVSSVYGKRDAVNVFRINSEYPNDGFWWDSQLRITAAYPPAPHFMEQYAHAVAQMDACRITRGGLFLDKAHSEEIETFARAYRALPAEKFETVGTSTDPAAVRTLVKDGVRYLYMVNREYYPIDVELYISQPAGQVIDLVSRQKINILSPWNLTLRPYDLRSFSLQPSVMIHDYTLHIPPAIVQGLIEDARNAMAQIRQVNSRGYFGSGLDKMYDDIESALKERRWSWLRHALASYPVCKCKELLLADQDVL
jgi:hypothetical protein